VFETETFPAEDIKVFWKELASDDFPQKDVEAPPGSVCQARERRPAYR
jgi:hypothetical protein